MKNFNFNNDLYFTPRKPDDYLMTLTWDYSGNVGFMRSQHEWNQTIIPKINQISVNIHNKTLRGGGNCIKLHPSIGHILQDLEHYHHGDPDILAGRYKIIYDSDLPQNEMIIYQEDKEMLDNGFIIVMKGELEDELDNEPEIGNFGMDRNPIQEISLELINLNDLTSEQKEKYIKNRQGRIKILNYE
jgi:hypothetical protein